MLEIQDLQLGKIEEEKSMYKKKIYDTKVPKTWHIDDGKVD
jgi:hypothetical protein